MSKLRFLLAPDKFKGSLTGEEFCEIAAGEIAACLPEASVDCCPLADGGEGSLDCFVRNTGARRVCGEFTGPNFQTVRAQYAAAGDTAFIETAQTAGLALASPRDATHTTTFGVGEQIAAAAAGGARRILLALGGSATNDAGCGMAAALGVRFYNAAGGVFVPTGGTLCEIAEIKFPAERLPVRVTALCDVGNDLYGSNGAAAVYARQKGASDEQIAVLDAGLRHCASLCARYGRPVEGVRGAGAAGGLGAGVAFFLGGDTRSGTDVFFELCSIDRKIAAADIILTGEGKIDGQTRCGKVVQALWERSAGKPFTAFCGVNEWERPAFEVIAVNRPGEGVDEAIAHTKQNFRAALHDWLLRLRR